MERAVAHGSRPRPCSQDIRSANRWATATPSSASRAIPPPSSVLRLGISRLCASASPSTTSPEASHTPSYMQYLDINHILDAYEESTLRVMDESPARLSLNWELCTQLRACHHFDEFKRLVVRDRQVLNAGTISLAMAMISLRMQPDGRFDMRVKGKQGTADNDSTHKSGAAASVGSKGHTQRKGDADNVKGIPTTSASPAAAAKDRSSKEAPPLWMANLGVGRVSAGYVSTSERPQPTGSFPAKEQVSSMVLMLLKEMREELPKVRVDNVATAMFCTSRMVGSPLPADAAKDAIALLAFIQEDLFVASPHDLSRLAQGVALLDPRALPSTWMDEFCKVTQSKFYAMDARQLALVGWGITRTGHLPDALWSHSFFDATRKAMASDEPQLAHSLSLCVRTASRLRQLPDEDWLDIAASRTQKLLPSIQPDGFAAILHSLCRMGHKPEEQWLQACLGYLDGHGEEMSPRSDCLTLASIAGWGFQPPEALLTKHVLLAQERLSEYNAEDLTQLLSSLARLQYLPPKAWLQAWLKQSRKHMRNSSPAGLAGTLVSFAAWGIRPPPDYLKALYEIELTFSRMSSMTVRQLSQSMRAMCALQQLPPRRWVLSMLIAFSDAATTNTAALEDVTAVLYCLSSLIHMSDEPDLVKDPAFVTAVDRIILLTEQLLPTMEGAQLHAIMVGLAGAKYPVSNDFLTIHATCVSSRLTELSVKQKASIGRCYILLRQASEKGGKKKSK